jgi:hypothetical protein
MEKMPAKNNHNYGYEPAGLEVAEAERGGWGSHPSSNMLPEVAAPGMWDKKAQSTPEVVPQYNEFTPDIDYRYSFRNGRMQMEDGGRERRKGGGPTPMICGLRRKVFYIVLGVGVLVATAAIAIGVGAGIAFGNKPSTDSSAAAPG